jgi:hypothetical protein
VRLRAQKLGIAGEKLLSEILQPDLDVEPQIVFRTRHVCTPVAAVDRLQDVYSVALRVARASLRQGRNDGVFLLYGGGPLPLAASSSSRSFTDFFRASTADFHSGSWPSFFGGACCDLGL